MCGKPGGGGPVKSDELLLASLGSTSDHCLRLQFVNGLAFVYDPIFIESPTATYLIDWRNKKMNREVAKYIAYSSGTAPSVLHMFVYPVKKVCLVHPLLLDDDCTSAERLVLCRRPDLEYYRIMVGVANIRCKSRSHPSCFAFSSHRAHFSRDKDSPRSCGSGVRGLLN